MSLTHYFVLINLHARLSLKADASRHHLGYLWWVLEPLIYVGIFYLVFEVLLGVERDNFLMFLMCGKLPFVWFSKSVLQSANSIVGSAGLIGQIDIPKSLFPMATCHEGLYKQAAVFLLLFVVLAVFGFYPTLQWFWLLPLMVVNYLMIVGCAFIAAVMVCYMRDSLMFISLGMTLLLFTSGVFWDVRTLQSEFVVNMVLTYNPLAFILDAYRLILMDGRAPDVLHLSLLAVFFAAMIGLLILLMRRYNCAIALRAVCQ